MKQVAKITVKREPELLGGRKFISADIHIKDDEELAIFIQALQTEQREAVHHQYVCMDLDMANGKEYWDKKTAKIKALLDGLKQ